MTDTTREQNLEKRVQELLAFAKEKEIFIGAVQQINQKGYIETTPLFRDLHKYETDVEAVETPETK